MTPEFEAAANYELDIIPAGLVRDDIIEELDAWAELGWIMHPCGCLIGPVFVAHEHRKPPGP